MSEDQKAAVDQYVARRGHPPSRPYLILTRSPEVMRHLNEVGVYLTYHSPLSGYLFEFACLMVARDWGSDYVWNVHQKDMERDNIFKPEIAADLRVGRRPRNMTEDEDIVYDFLIELQRNKSVSEPSYQRALKRFGEKGIIDLIAIQALYAMLSMTANVARVPLPFEGAVPLPHFPD
ncbi:MAG: carboxymuconolactone decarboxylase family protein [Hyphomicrobiales bacterium]|nr:carboxymuconolactone decarboxylase family protein [Hyphomicrobiales bacterium]